MKAYLRIFALFGVTSAASLAGTVTALNFNDLNLADDIVLANSSSTALSGTIIAVGWYDAGFDVAGAVAVNDYASLSSASNFNVLTSALSGDTTSAFGSNIAGYFETPNQNYGAPTAGMLASPQLYILFGNGATLASPTSEYALVRFNEFIDPDVPFADSNTLNLTGGSYAILAGTTGTAVVNLSSVGGSATESNTSLNLVAVPEPSAALLGALGMVGLLRRRRMA
jgi:hypothetical protein